VTLTDLREFYLGVIFERSVCMGMSAGRVAYRRQRSDQLDVVHFLGSDIFDFSRLFPLLQRRSYDSC